ncbi:Cell wall-associated hydrolase, NlpC family [Actinacidiphila rubida]|uniref:Cell wall-associated hydrolase, NlpC family n=2 Tax=Actinacidiphila rubida TaxID=310780 RepID=A0A1H8S5G7_9ACTN|nr:C40 family peptidase [Actinacidiphila rubida]SEO73776.1 Cell wall-associated hydrolase, NlpC family [Actinacidiphila rubida]
MKGLAAVLGLLCLTPLLIAGLSAVSAAGAGPAFLTAACTTGTVDTAAVEAQVVVILGGTAPGPDSHVDGLDLPAEQIPNAKAIIVTGITLHVPARGQIIALATALQESRLRNLPTGDRDSVGLFQQRPSEGWGTPAQLLDPVYASSKFYSALLAVPGWQQLTVIQGAQAVQHSALPDAYATWEPLATALQQAITTTLPATEQPTNPDSPADTTGPPAPVTGCGPADDGSQYGPIPPGTVPAGYTIPADAPEAVKTAITWAMHQLGTPYQWGGSCTDSHGPDPMGRCDCSSLVQQAYREAGITLPRNTYTQVNAGVPVPLNALRPGDLLFTEGSPDHPEHVGIYLGAGLVIAAPHTGTVVRIDPIAQWDVLAARRLTAQPAG